jgi:hypothetical protein
MTLIFIFLKFPKGIPFLMVNLILKQRSTYVVNCKVKHGFATYIVNTPLELGNATLCSNNMYTVHSLHTLAITILLL